MLWARKERERECVHQISFQSCLNPPTFFFFFNLEIYSRAACNLFFFLTKLFIHKKQVRVAWDILQIHVELFWIFYKLAKNSLYIFNRMCLYLKQHFCEAGENSVTPAIFFCVEPVCSPTDSFIKGCSGRAASPS